MLFRFSSVGPLLLLLFLGVGILFAQSIPPEVPTTNTVNPTPPPSAESQDSTAGNPTISPAAQPASFSSGPTEVSMSRSDFLVEGVPHAKVLYMEGNVWVRSPEDQSSHLLEKDEPVALHSVIFTGSNGILDLATGPGMAMRLVPRTLIRVSQLPEASTLSASTLTAPQTCRIGLKVGTVFSALGRSDGQPIDFQVRTPYGVAAARGTMFASSISDGQAQVDMLHGTVNFETADHQRSQISAGQSQQITGTPGGHLTLNESKTLSPADSTAFFTHAAGLLEHASGSGVVRRGLGPEVASTLPKEGVKLPAQMQERFQNSAKSTDQNPATAEGAKRHATGPNAETQKSDSDTEPTPRHKKR